MQQNDSVFPAEGGQRHPALPVSLSPASQSPSEARSGLNEAEDDSMAASVVKTLQALSLGVEDSAASRLALAYAEAIDAATDKARALADLGPKLKDVLMALGATPQARGQEKKGGVQIDDRLADFRNRRTA